MIIFSFFYGHIAINCYCTDFPISIASPFLNDLTCLVNLFFNDTLFPFLFLLDLDLDLDSDLDSVFAFLRGRGVGGRSV